MKHVVTSTWKVQAVLGKLIFQCRGAEPRLHQWGDPPLLTAVRFCSRGQIPTTYSSYAWLTPGSFERHARWVK